MFECSFFITIFVIFFFKCKWNREIGQCKVKDNDETFKI